jgi:hypothetical protein
VNKEEPFQASLNSRARVMDSGLQKKTFPCKAVQNSQNPVGAAVFQPLMKEVQAPGLVRSRQLHLRLTGNLKTPSASSVQPEAFLAPDPLGYVVMVRDTSGNTVYEAEYDPYGNVQSETGTKQSSFGYVGTLTCIKEEEHPSSCLLLLYSPLSSNPCCWK